MRLSLFVAIPATLLLLSLAHPLVVAIFMRGQFDSASAHETARALIAQGAGIWTVAAVRQLVPVYYALGDTRTPVIVSALDLAAFIALALSLRGPLGHAGVSCAVSGSSAVQMILLWVLLARRLPQLHVREIAVSAGRTLVASAAAAASAWGIARSLAPHPAQSSGSLARIAPAAAGAIVFVLVFGLVARSLGSEEIRTLMTGFRHRFSPRERSR